MTAPRLAWLDALRGYAAVVVAAFHLSPVLLGADRHLQIYRQFDLGKYGVLLFFLVSGYVIPMSLERHGSLRRFWIGRLFRIYPAYLFTIAVALGLAATGMYRLPGQLTSETAASVLGHATMLQDLLGVRGVVRPFWTLSFEMTFYLVTAGLFAWRWHRTGAWWAAGLTLVSLAGGTRLPDDLLGGSAPDRRTAAAAVALLVMVSCGAYIWRRNGLALPAGAIGIGLIALPLVNGHASRWVTSASSAQAALMLAVMFAGTVVYRAQHRQIGRRGAAATLTLVFAGLALHQWSSSGTGLLRWTAMAVAVTATFVIAFALRNRPVPAVLTWLGAVSYSLYLLHLLVLGLIVRLTGNPLLIALAFTAGTLSVAWAAHRWVELPGQALGRRIGERFPAIGVATQGGTPRTGSFGKQRESV
ncbi:acyltransferase family protein [Actinoplanes aureus]|uniref:Acyltransferase n=1 Tax=Actinoplanes aureus TaxID=2792083 RepID=A0A931CH21_9ACTN|nr:acyltransferase [Actinoplanes aureus]MBG0567427.1 acyltransferase [Actinoplanes aureus]